MVSAATCSTNGAHGQALAPASTASVGPACWVGAAFCSVAAIGLLRRVILAIPFDLWLYLVVLVAGAACILGDALARAWSSGGLHEHMMASMRRQIAFGQRMYLLSMLPLKSPREWQALLADMLHPIVALAVGSHGLPDFLNRLRARQAYASSSAGTLLEHVPAALAWLRRPQHLALCYEDQLQLHGLAQQFNAGDCQAPPLGEDAEPLVQHRRQAWEGLRGLSSKEAGLQLVRSLVESDPTFCVAHPEVTEGLPLEQAPAAVNEVPGAEYARVLCGLLEQRVPPDLDERIEQAKRRISVTVLGSVAFLQLVSVVRRSTRWRLFVASVRRLIRATHPGKLALVFFSAYLYALTHGLPPAVYARLPRLLRGLPAAAAQLATSTVGGIAAPRLSRRAVQALVPPVRGRSCLSEM